MPKYSICIPTFNRAHSAINALESAINQKFNDFEVLLIDDHSDDNHKTVIEDYINGIAKKNFTYIRNHSNLGLFGNWNKCIDSAKGQYLSILSDDDLLAPIFLESIDSVVEKYPNCSYFVKKKEFDIFKPLEVSGRIGTFDISKVRCLDRNIFRWFNGLGTPAGFVFPRSLGSELRFNEKYYPSSDYDFYIRISKNKNIYYLDDVLAYVGKGLNVSLELDTIYGFTKKDMLLRKNCGQIDLINSAIEAFQLNNYLLSYGLRDGKNIFAVIMNLLFKLIRKLIFKWYC